MPVVAPPGERRRTAGRVPVVHPAALAAQAAAVGRLVEKGTAHLGDLLGLSPPGAEVLLVDEGGWDDAPRDGARPYPYGYPYYTRAVRPPTLVLPVDLAPRFGPRTGALYPLAVWHELAHAYLLDRGVVRTPPWLHEFAAQAAAAAVARREGLLAAHLARLDGAALPPARGRPRDPDGQMAHQNALLRLADAAASEFGEGYVGRLFGGLRAGTQAIGDGEAEGLLARALGPGGGEWLARRPDL